MKTRSQNHPPPPLQRSRGGQHQVRDGELKGRGCIRGETPGSRFETVSSVPRPHALRPGLGLISVSFPDPFAVKDGETLKQEAETATAVLRTE